MDLKDNIELLQAASEYSKFLSMFIPNALQLLKVVQPKFAENYSENVCLVANDRLLDVLCWKY